VLDDRFGIGISYGIINDGLKNENVIIGINL
jgi:hypothetical protein